MEGKGQPQVASSEAIHLVFETGTPTQLELAHEGKLASQRASGIYPLPPLGQGDNSVLLYNGGPDRIGKATEGAAPRVKEPRIGCGSISLQRINTQL